MERRQLGPLGAVSVLSLGGGGIGQVWGATDRGQAVRTVRAAVDAGITLFDLAPAYGNGEAERVAGEAFRGGYPDDVRVSTKCMVGTVGSEPVQTRIETSLQGSFERLGRDDVDALILHDFLVPNGFRLAEDFDGPEWIRHVSFMSTPVSSYFEAVVPALENLVQRGLIRTWGVSALGPASPTLLALGVPPRPGLVQCVANVLNSAGDLRLTDEAPRHRDLAATAARSGIGVLGIRAVQAGALTAAFDREVDARSRDAADFERASGFRRLAEELGCTPSYLAHRYALTIPNVDSVVLGVKNPLELAECVAAADDGPLDATTLRAVEVSVRRTTEAPDAP